jgi:hypothetical protein
MNDENIEDPGKYVSCWFCLCVPRNKTDSNLRVILLNVHSSLIHISLVRNLPTWSRTTSLIQKTGFKLHANSSLMQDRQAFSGAYFGYHPLRSFPIVTRDNGRIIVFSSENPETYRTTWNSGFAQFTRLNANLSTPKYGYSQASVKTR